MSLPDYRRPDRGPNPLADAGTDQAAAKPSALLGGAHREGQLPCRGQSGSNLGFCDGRPMNESCGWGVDAAARLGGPSPWGRDATLLPKVIADVAVTCPAPSWALKEPPRYPVPGAGWRPIEIGVQAVTARGCTASWRGRTTQLRAPRPAETARTHRVSSLSAPRRTT